jgi:hypothetical protein
MALRRAIVNQVYHQLVLRYISVNYFYIDFIIVIRRLDDGHGRDRNMLLKNNNK